VCDLLISFHVEFLISPVSLYVVPRLLHECDNEYECEGSDIGEQEADLEGGDQLRQADQQEEQVEEELELVIQHDRDKCQDVVLSVTQLIGWEVTGIRNSIQKYCSFL
jgi:hypothetical protein